MPLVALGQELYITGYYAQWLLEIVRCDIRKLLQFIIGRFSPSAVSTRCTSDPLRSVMLRMAAVTRMPSAFSSGFSMISIGNSLPSFRCR
jgi:hypothetical protein